MAGTTDKVHKRVELVRGLWCWSRVEKDGADGGSLELGDGQAFVRLQLDLGDEAVDSHDDLDAAFNWVGGELLSGD